MRIYATLYSTTLTEALRQFSYRDLEQGYSENWIPNESSTWLFSLDSHSADLQKWCQDQLGIFGYIRVILTHELAREIQTYFKFDKLEAQRWNNQIRPQLAEPNKVLYIQFSTFDFLNHD